MKFFCVCIRGDCKRYNEVNYFAIFLRALFQSKVRSKIEANEALKLIRVIKGSDINLGFWLRVVGLQNWDNRNNNPKKSKRRRKNTFQNVLHVLISRMISRANKRK
jgi:hypothetical protein